MKTTPLRSLFLLGCCYWLSGPVSGQDAAVASANPPGPTAETRFDLGEIARRNPEIAALGEGRGFPGTPLIVTPRGRTQSLTVWRRGDPGSWRDARYLVVEAYGREDYSGRIAIEFYRAGGGGGAVDLQSGRLATEERPRLLSLQGILPRLPTKLVFPLDHLDAQRIFLPRFPRQLKGTLTGGRLEPGDIAEVRLNFGPFAKPHFTPVFEVAAVALRTSLPEPYPALETPIIDALGQWRDKDWPGKAASEEEMVRRNRALLAGAATAAFPDAWSPYGGWKELKFEATGYFRTHHDGRRWWLVDPDGCAFLSAGVTCVGTSASGPVNGIEDFFAWLPQPGDTRFGAAAGGRRGDRSVDFLKANLIRSFGGDWQDSWSRATAGLMRQLHLNTVGNWSDVEFARAHKLPYVLQMRDFPTTRTRLFRDFPDVFSAEYATAAEQFARQLAPFREDRLLIGYFLLNEPHWGFGYHNLAFEMFATPTPSTTKDAFAAWLRERYREDAAGFERDWKLPPDGLSGVASLTFKNPPTKAAEQAFHEFSRVMVRKYVDVVCDQVEIVAPHHLNLGMRYAWISSDLMFNAGERFDVFSINGYGNPGPPETREISRRSGKPVIIGEWHFGATDRGLPATGIQGALDQRQRAQAYRYYAEQAFARPELVGIHYFQWNDQPFYGRFDGENYNIGVVDITNHPYEELAAAMIETHGRMYGIASGTIRPFDQRIERVPSIHY